MTHPDNDANPQPVDFAYVQPSPRPETLGHPGDRSLEAGNLARSGRRDSFAFQACIITHDRVHLILTPPPGTSLEKSVHAIRNDAVPEICAQLGIPFSSWQDRLAGHEFPRRTADNSQCNPGKTFLAGMRIWFPDEVQSQSDGPRDRGAGPRSICLTAQV
jgi:hypothetical protein